MKTLILSILFFPLALMAQINTNIVIISGAGNATDNGIFVWDADPSFKVWTNAYTYIAHRTGSLYALDNYYSTNFPYVWYDVGYAGWPPPDPTGVYGGTATAIFWSPPSFTNFWTVPGDYVTFQASGRNMAVATNMSALQVTLDTNIVYSSSLCAGNGANFSLDGRFQWDGTNIAYFSEMASGDPSNAQAAVFGVITNKTVGTNAFSITVLDNTNGFLLLNASITASRCPQGVATPSGINALSPGAITFTATNL